MPILKRSLALTCILIPAAALLSLGCGIFTLPVVGPKALVTNSKYLHFTVEITDDTGAPLNDVKVAIQKYSMDNNFFFGEVDKSDYEEKTVSGTLDYSDFGHYAVSLTFSKEGYGAVHGVYANADTIHHSSEPFGGGLGDERALNVKNYPKQHVMMSKGPAVTPTPGPAHTPPLPEDPH